METATDHVEFAAGDLDFAAKRLSAVVLDPDLYRDLATDHREAVRDILAQLIVFRDRLREII